jgi:hypothetical protein
MTSITIRPKEKIFTMHLPSALQDLSLLQWIKRYFDMHYGGVEYNAVERRGGFSFAAKENTAGNAK